MDPVVFGSFFPERIPKEGDPAADIADMISEKDIQFLLSTFESNPSNVKEEWFRILSKQGRAISGRERNIINDVRISDSIKLLSESEEDVSLSILSRKAGLSPSRFRHLFREETGITFSGYKLWLKTQKAIFSLRDRLELTTAAYEGGFSDQAHFSRIFRRSFGISPSDFAKKPDRFHVRFFFS
ncbi:AraC family transcriptional regulator [Leptospira gomenensis]|uniref:AraC family transcriptional regulator n=2 Tax=Leptospira gomenensis TaxID=2484974 RepID=A0A5F1YBB8_9LEPT|nr:AraC family transcriptional regulator [Leptospira gomenensis]TGK38592.1 AraC family transcriptional regulator [Leptospira gomenensis]TGK51116.1 AraC family transcriptional regulator [Leptospira gomenensis]TGK68357.1 AraC family transcriptional regulator [Leptospira gomenensis]